MYIKHLEHLENKRLSPAWDKICAGSGKASWEGEVLDRTLKYRQNLNTGKETFRVEETKAENLVGGGPAEPFVLGSSQNVVGSTALGERSWLFQALPRIQGESGLLVVLKCPKALVNNTPLRRKRRYRKAVQYSLI